MNKILRHLRGLERAKLRSGPGARIFESGFGRIVRFNGAGADFNHPWLATITGEFTADDLLGVIFGRFCIGK